jgi:hypothetical protein
MQKNALPDGVKNALQNTAGEQNANPEVIDVSEWLSEIQNAIPEFYKKTPS